MTYLPQIEIPEWVEILSVVLSYLFVVSIYSIFIIGVLNISNILEFNVFYYIGIVVTMFISLYGVIFIQEKLDPVGW